MISMSISPKPIDAYLFIYLGEYSHWLQWLSQQKDISQVEGEEKGTIPATEASCD